MPSKGVTFRKPGVVKIVSGIAAHPKPSHDRSRAVVRCRCERDDLCESERPEPVAKCQSGCLRCIALSPMFERQTPADFHTGHEMGAESRNLQSSKPDKGCNPRDLDSP